MGTRTSTHVEINQIAARCDLYVSNHVNVLALADSSPEVGMRQGVAIHSPGHSKMTLRSLAAALRKRWPVGRWDKAPSTFCPFGE